MNIKDIMLWESRQKQNYRKKKHGSIYKKFLEQWNS